MLELLARAGMKVDVSSLEAEEMVDGGMGSLLFRGSEDRKFGAAAATLEFKNNDGVLVSVALYVDQSGAPFELDVWKVDFSPTAKLAP